MKKISLLTITVLSFLTLAACSSPQNETSATNNTVSESKEDVTVEEYFDAIVDKVGTVTKDEYNEQDYGTYDYKTLLRNPEDYFREKVWLYNLEVIQVSKEGKYTKLIAHQPNGDLYMLFIQTRRLESKLLEDDMLSINGRYVLDFTYKNVAGNDKTVPLIYIDAYRLDS